MTIVKSYYYLFYKLYKFFLSHESTKWLADVKAIILLCSLEVWLLFSLNNYFDFLNHHHSKLSFFSLKVVLPLFFVLIIKWILFIKNEDWKGYVQEFDKLPYKKNRKGTWIVFAIVIVSAANFVFSFFLNPPIHLK
ncbi:hypothetical protein HQ865_11315 [Mucilaginibacter mali]|uniref:Uncharacterized protein n=1 Tax=Mucilaginibacter mali TaxID=2740462 RepID=A0A7D4QB08_9SPHI|nr:hypothetical protein [Mucilaginibacter mali]QKJ30324.1 hypothetical protein HQ865_11315 [Mucilaginibacter mali]